MNTAKPRVLMLIPSVAKTDVAEAVRNDAHPTMDYHALQAAWGAEIFDYAALNADQNPILVKLAQKAGRDAALAMAGYLKRRDYDIIYSNGENVSIPLAMLLKRHKVRPRHVLIGHHLSTGKKKLFFRALHSAMDAIFVYSSVQQDYGIKELGIPKAKLPLIPFHADHRFYRCLPASSDAPPRMISSAGLEWRDYPTMLDAVNGLDVEVRLAAASPWSKHQNETENRTLPPNVSARRYPYNELRQLYADSRFVVVPLYENDFQAGITTILEAMACGKAVITSKTMGQIDTIVDGVNGIYVPPGDAGALRNAISRLLEDPKEAARLGANARTYIEENATLDRWVQNIVTTSNALL